MATDNVECFACVSLMGEWGEIDTAFCDLPAGHAGAHHYVS